MQRAAPVRTALLIYFVVVMLLAWWPWNVLLVLTGATYGARLDWNQSPALLRTRTDDAAVEAAQGIEHVFITGNDVDALAQNARVVRGEHFAYVPRYPLVDHAFTLRSAIDQRSRGERGRVRVHDVAAGTDAIGTAGKPKFGELPRGR